MLAAEVNNCFLLQSLCYMKQQKKEHSAEALSRFLFVLSMSHVGPCIS